MITFADLDIWLRIAVAFVYVVIILVIVAFGLMFIEKIKLMRRERKMCNPELTKPIGKKEEDEKNTEESTEEN